MTIKNVKLLSVVKCLKKWSRTVMVSSGLVLVAIVLARADDKTQESNSKKNQTTTVSDKKQEDNDKKIQSCVKAMELALKEAAKKHDLASSDFKATIRPTNEGWSVSLVFLPETPGADIAIRVRRDGRVTIVSGF